MARYLVTGATGFIGAEVVKQLIGRGHQVVALVRSPEKATLLGTLGVEIHAGDITDRESLRAPMTGVDGVFHIAAWYKIGVREASAERTNVGGTRHVLETMREIGVPKGVYTSSVSVFGDTHGTLVDESYFSRGPFLTEYDRTKWKAHYEVALPMAASGLPLVIVRPGLVYGPGDTSGVRSALVQLLRGRLAMTPSRTQYCWGYVEDTARGLIQAMDGGRIGESYLLTGPVHAFDEAFAIAARLAGTRAPFVHPGPRIMRIAAALTGALERLNLRGPYPAEALRLLAGTTWIGSNAKARHELGFTPRALADGWRATIEHEMRLLGMS
jgi:nucleoside-diphosphate-sugar epimerase